MRIYFNYKKLVIITSPKSIRFNLLVEVNKSLERKIKFFIRHNESLAAHIIKTRISFKYKHENDTLEHIKQ